MRSLAFSAVLLTAFASTSAAQLSPVPVKNPPWADTTNESPIYPVGEAVPVYRAVLDFIYLDGNKRPSVIVMRDTAEGRMGGPCAFAKCLGEPWKHKSKMDTATVLSFARFSRKRPGMVQFGYPIPIVFISQDDVRRMDADGREAIASNPMPNDLPKRSWGFWAELQRKHPGAWGVIILSKVGFNKRHTEALVQAHQWCGDDCRVHETFFLRQTKGRWRIVERIPEQVDAGSLPYGRYLGPIGKTPKESELIPVDRPGVPTEATARADVYRTVLDSLYSVNGERPKRIVLTNWAWTGGEIPAHTSDIDSTLIKRFSVLGAIRAPFDAISRYRVPISTLPLDSVPALRDRGVALDIEKTGYPFYVALAKTYPGAWGMLGVSRIAFDASRSQALVNTYHACGNDCVNRDTWFLTRTGKAWKIAERIPGERQGNVEVEPLRYLGVDVNPTAYWPRRVRGVVTDEGTGKPMKNLNIRVRRLINSGVMIEDPSLRTDSLGAFTLTRLPLNAGISLFFDCPNGRREPVFTLPIGVTPGMDTTINASFPFSECNQPPPDSAEPVSGVSTIPQSPSFPNIPGKRLSVDLKVSSVVVRGDTVGITYVVRNRPTSQDSLVRFIVDAPATVKRIPQPKPDSDYSVLETYRGRPVANWAFLGLLAPSATSTALYFESVGIPDTVTFWAGGNFPLPNAEMPPDTLPTDRIKRSVPGKTVGVRPWPSDRTAGALLTRLRNSTQAVCGTPLMWITDARLCGQLVSDVDRAQAYRTNGQRAEARTTLDHFVALLTGTNGGFATGVTSPAYWLLVSNASIVRRLF